ncbi:MAG: FMN-binding protein [Chloroflexi bacterium]|nr:FMN-binding protein [Chloroflexota bacterium]
MAKHRMHRGLVALSAAAIAAVYAAGYLHTQAADASLASAERNAAVVAIAARPTLPPSPTPTLQPFAGRTRGDERRSPAGRGEDRRSSPSRASPPAPRLAAPTVVPTPSTSNPAPTTASYKDGTYTGSGQSRFGDVEVRVTIQSGRIAEVTITRATTRYPVSRIAALPGRVVARQSAQVDLVSGATYSALAFRTAVQQALVRAQ